MTEAEQRSIRAGAEATIRDCDRACRLLLLEGPARTVSITRRHAEELDRFLQAHKGDLERVLGLDAFDSVVVRQAELNQAVQFVEQAFLSPRTHGKRQALEAADWMCVEGFCCYESESDGPIGPLVAIDARRSPAVWEPGRALPMPSLFQINRELVQRAQQSGLGKLAHFPVICLPSNLTELPEYFPLLSHEVGHAIDCVRGLTSTILADIAEDLLGRYWHAWMREMVADAFGLALSGSAFTVALANYIRLFPEAEHGQTTSSAYPGVGLRLKMLSHAAERLGCRNKFARHHLLPIVAEPLSQRGQQLLDDYTNRVHELMYRVIIECSDAWRTHQQFVDEQSERLVADRGSSFGIGNLPDRAQLFRLLPSIVTMAQIQDPKLETFTSFDRMHRSAKELQTPAWLTHSSQWTFTTRDLPTFRPTLLSENDQTKIPPQVLLVGHDRIAFVGATNGQLAKALTTAFELRQRPWTEIELYFASDHVLSHVIRMSDPDDSASGVVGTSELIRERDAAERELRKLLDKPVALRWTISRFDGALVFGSFWDWDRPGGRIHVSAQLLGTDLRRCPAVDMVWYDERPSPTYEKFLTHLNEVRRRAVVRFAGS